MRDPVTSFSTNTNIWLHHALIFHSNHIYARNTDKVAKILQMSVVNIHVLSLFYLDCSKKNLSLFLREDFCLNQL